LRFRKNVPDLPGIPDIVFGRAKLAVFVDGHFWHGYQLQDWQDKLSDSWRSKIEATRQRDKRAEADLQRLGYRVIRFWDHDLSNDIDLAVTRIREALRGTPL
jgi:DNA mismatch endonuclease (patch repair protein)